MKILKRMTVRQLQQWHRDTYQKGISAQAIYKNIAAYGLPRKNGAVDGATYTAEYMRREQNREAEQGTPLPEVKPGEKKRDYATEVVMGTAYATKPVAVHLAGEKLAMDVLEKRKQLIPIEDVMAAFSEICAAIKDSHKDILAATRVAGASVELVSKHKTLLGKALDKLQRKFPFRDPNNIQPDK